MTHLPTRPMPLIISPKDASKFTFEIIAFTDIIGGTALDTKYAKEVLTIDPFGELQNNCLIVVQFCGGEPHMCTWKKTGRDGNGRYIPSGHKDEYFSVSPGVLYCCADIGKNIHIHGRVVGSPRIFPLFQSTSEISELEKAA